MQIWRSIETSQLHIFVDLPVDPSQEGLTVQLCLAAARTVGEFPELKAWVYGSKVVSLNQVDAFLQIETLPGDLWGMWLRNVDRKTAVEIQSEIETKKAQALGGSSALKASTQKWIHSTPGFFLRPLMCFWTWGRAYLSGFFPKLFPQDAFCTFAISNTGRNGGPPRIPAANRFTPWSLKISVGEKIEKAIAENGVVRAGWVLPCVLTFDHRLIDAGQIGRFVHHFTKSFKNK